jgi:hypothetical protein
MSKIIQLHPTKRRVWHGLYFISLYDSDQMSQAEAEAKLRRISKQIEQHYDPVLALDLEEDSLNVCDLP